jgi:uncharacterized protein YqeY
MLYEVIKNKHTEAMKSRNPLLKSAYGNVLAKMMVAEKSGNYPLPLEDSVVESLIVKEIKELEETRSFYKPIDDKYEDISIQIAELNQYLPKALTELEVESMILGYAETSGETNVGKITGAIAKMVGNRFDKKLIKGIVEKVMKEA